MLSSHGSKYQPICRRIGQIVSVLKGSGTRSTSIQRSRVAAASRWSRPRYRARGINSACHNNTLQLRDKNSSMINGTYLSSSFTRFSLIFFKSLHANPVPSSSSSILHMLSHLDDHRLRRPHLLFFDKKMLTADLQPLLTADHQLLPTSRMLSLLLLTAP